jgi:hypothetical protein
LGVDEFKSAILSLKVNITKGEKFYGQLADHHYYSDGVDNSYYNNFLLTDISTKLIESSDALVYLDKNAKIEIGVDFGDMTSMVTAQLQGNNFYCLKEFYTLAPESSRELSQKFRDFYKNHRRKEVDMYYDPAGNQYHSIRRDWAHEIKDVIENCNGVPTGWIVNLKSENRTSIFHEEEFNFAKIFMGETNPLLPKLKIDRMQCKCLKSSLELTKILVKSDKTGSRTIHKDKSSEKLAMHLRPMYSTNFSDAFKYLIYRRDFIDLVNKRNAYMANMEPMIFGR